MKEGIRSQKYWAIVRRGGHFWEPILTGREETREAAEYLQKIYGGRVVWVNEEITWSDDFIKCDEHSNPLATPQEDTITVPRELLAGLVKSALKGSQVDPLIDQALKIIL